MHIVKSNIKSLNVKEKVIAILAANKNTYLTCRNIQHLIFSKWGQMPRDGTVSSILYKFTQTNMIERQENIGCKKGYGYKAIIPIGRKLPQPKVINAIMELDLKN